MAERADYQGSGLALVDDKGRVAIPNAMRSALAANSPRADGKDGGTIIIAAHEDQPCLVAYDPAYRDTLKAELARRLELSRGADGKVDQNIRRSFANGEEAPFDGSGRFVMSMLSQHLGGIEQHAFFYGMLDTIEIWNPKTLIETPGIDPKVVQTCRFYAQEKGIAL
ncbi:division/cell wall cluster transcriptional repressor MraZ [Sphingomonas oligophenolica]|uniref:Division/cell wall cluster transcriptional repressor MraZ n=1 Tax=Sphingomonas oligophenolica TaxID=301154 RepID=A0A502CN88_9SPHN|nr:division/cell wall cluster transcriptional repressor MraZ [Sphingomonas oligophenolica]TPG13236.1 division/cell wall cluster transcriptional repressor MraZ [Sphingomonas oligophenolica]